MLAPLDQEFADALDLDHDVGAHVSGLLCRSGEPDVPGFVVPVLIREPVDAEALWDTIRARWKERHDVGGEDREVVPLWTHLDSSPAIVGIVLGFRVVASVAHPDPCSVQMVPRLGMRCVAVRGLFLSVGISDRASARDGVLFKEAVNGYGYRLSAIALALYSDAFALGSLNPGDSGDDQPAEPFVDEFLRPVLGGDSLMGWCFHVMILTISSAIQNLRCDRLFGGKP
jgi:hypothetical protein